MENELHPQSENAGQPDAPVCPPIPPLQQAVVAPAASAPKAESWWKGFWKAFCGSLAALLIIGAFSMFMFFIMLGAVAAGSEVTPDVKDGSILKISLSGTITERSEENPFAALMGNELLTEQGLDDLLTAVKEAAGNPKISGIYLEGGALSADIASLQELRKALADFKKSGKFIVAYADAYTQGSYYVSSVADSVLINPSAVLDWHGIAAQPIFFTELMDKLGIRAQVFKVGTYKSAVEPYILTSMSDANREQVASFIGDIWTVLVDDVAASRKLKSDSLRSYAAHFTAFQAGESYLKKGLVDKLAYVDEVRETLRNCSGRDKIDFITPQALAQTAKPASGKHIAVYYAFGDIVDEAASTAFGSSAQIVGSKVVEDLDELMNDKDVSAVVLRINSGGGSAYASEQMWHAIRLLAEKKPVVVSMGGMAASGGYYMSCAADYVIAEPTTLTGSIGIFGMIPDFSGLLTDKLGLHFDLVSTNPGADFGSTARPINAAEGAALQAYIERGYALFLSRVAEGRGMSTAAVDSIGQGRVWTGNQALKIGLVDKLGALDDAVAEAAKRAGVEKQGGYVTKAYPAPASWLDRFKSEVEEDYMERKVHALLGENYRHLQFLRSLPQQSRVQARIPFDPNLQ